MAEIGMKDLLEAGVHFGHQTRRWNPQMMRYIFMERNGIYIIDLQKTIKCIQDPCKNIDVSRCSACGPGSITHTRSPAMGNPAPGFKAPVSSPAIRP